MRFLHGIITFCVLMEQRATNLDRLIDQDSRIQYYATFDNSPSFPKMKTSVLSVVVGFIAIVCAMPQNKLPHCGQVSKGTECTTAGNGAFIGKSEALKKCNAAFEACKGKGKSSGECENKKNDCERKINDGDRSPMTASETFGRDVYSDDGSSISPAPSSSKVSDSSSGSGSSPSPMAGSSGSSKIPDPKDGPIPMSKVPDGYECTEEL
jgi:hypothetical protein